MTYGSETFTIVTTDNHLFKCSRKGKRFGSIDIKPNELQMKSKSDVKSPSVYYRNEHHMVKLWKTSLLSPITFDEWETDTSTQLW